MTQVKKTPDPEKFKRATTRLHETCKQLDALDVLLDDLEAKVEADVRRSPLTQYRLRRAKQALQSLPLPTATSY
jgi:hypothetical protein